MSPQFGVTFIDPHLPHILFGITTTLFQSFQHPCTPFLDIPLIFLDPSTRIQGPLPPRASSNFHCICLHHHPACNITLFSTGAIPTTLLIHSFLTLLSSLITNSSQHSHSAALVYILRSFIMPKSCSRGNWCFREEFVYKFLCQ